MSINVTVTGNPVCIKRGKMVTADPKDVHKEFQKRRKIRLEQVRQQSKEIAESVRNKVKKEKSKQSSNIEKQSATKFNEWQNSKLLELQNQYRESLKDIGLGHTQARIEEAVETEFIEKRDKHNETAAVSRGQLAQQQQQILRNEENLKKAIPVQTRRLARDVENARAAMVCKLKNCPVKKKRRRKSLVNVSITKDVSDSESDSDDGVDLVEDDKEESRSSGMTEFQEIPHLTSERSSGKPVSPKKKKSAHEVVELRDKEVLSKSRDVVNELENPRNECPKKSPTVRNHKSSLVTVTTTDTSISNQPFDTRISDRIKNRRLIDSRILPNHPSTINENSETSSEDAGIRPHAHNRKETIDVDIHKPAGREYFEHCGAQTNSNCKERNHSRKEREFDCSTRTKLNCKEKCCSNCSMQNNLNYEEKSNQCKCLNENKCTCAQITKTNQTQTSLDKQKSCDLPSMPTISLRTCGSQNNRDKRDYTRVQYYDHDNRFNKDYIIDGADVQKISQESIEVCFNEDSETDFQKGGFEREKTAQLRGKRALEKQKIQRDYEVLLRKLPVLQKQERIAGLDPERDKFHMSEKRLKDFEKNRQGKIEEAFEKLTPNTITIQPKKQNVKEREKSPAFKAVDTKQREKERPVLKTVDLEKGNNLAWKSVTNLLNRNNSETSRENLRSLLERLKAQKEILMQENNALPENSNLYNLLSDLEMCNKKSSSATTTSSSSTQSNYKQNFKKGGTPKKRRHNLHRDVLILQNTSTQTSPKIEKVCDGNKGDSNVDEISGNDCKQQGVKRTCKDKNEEIPEASAKKIDDGKCVCPENEGDKICEIFIKIQDNEKPEIVICSPKDRKGAVSIDVKKIDDDQIDSNFEKKKSKNVEKSEKQKSCLTKKNEPVRKNKKNENGSFWREQLSKNDATNSSTSYYSPPDYSKDSTNENICSILSRKPQQSNVSIQTKQTQKPDLDLHAYIKRLLEMSKGSIENLCVSSVSEVSTPSSSVIENQNNINPAQKLINLLKHLNINVDKRTRNLNMISKQNQTDGNKTQSTQSKSEVMSNESPRMSARVNEVRLVDSPENILVKNITDITDKCQEKINKLTEKIQSLRAEQFQMVSPGNNSNGSDKENLTGYLHLPSMLIQDANSSKSNSCKEANNKRSPEQTEHVRNNSCRSNSPEQIELTRNLLRVDLTNPKPTFENPNNLVKTLSAGPNRGEFNDEIDADLIERYIKLIAVPPNENNSIPFVPVLMDIPKLPKLATNNNQNHEKKPPPSKGLRFINLDMIPHELSTIPEGDSIRRSKSPESPRCKRQEDLIQELLRNSRHNKCSANEDLKKIQNPAEKTNEPSSSDNSLENQDLNALKQIPKIQSPKQITKNCNEIEFNAKNSSGWNFSKLSESKRSSPQKIQSPCTCSISPPSDENKKTYDVSQKSNERKQNDELYKNPKPGPSREVQTQRATSEELIRIMQRLKDVSTDSSTDKSEEIESILKNLGMNWAVATLKKTQEAFARNSSSNSSSTSKTTSSSTPDINQSNSVSGSSLKSNNFLQENFQELSAIHGSFLSAEKQQRTSTPVQTTRSSERSRKGKDKMFTGESDLSSVKEKSKDNEWKFISIPECTADDSTMID